MQFLQAVCREATTLLDCHPPKNAKDTHLCVFTIRAEKNLLQKLFVRIVLELTDQDADFPLRRTENRSAIKNKLSFAAKIMTQDKQTPQTDPYRTRKNIEEYLKEEAVVLIDESSRLDEIGFAMIAFIMTNNLLDDEPWYDSTEELAEVIDYLLTFKRDALRQVLQHRGAFKSLYRKGRAIVRTIGQEDAQELERYERVLTALSDPEHNTRYMTWPYSHLLAHVTGCLKGNSVLSRTDVVTAVLATGPETAIDCEVAGRMDIQESKELWDTLAAMKLLLGTITKPNMEISLKKIVNRLAIPQCVESKPESTLTWIACWRCSFRTSSRKYLLRHIRRTHRKESLTSDQKIFRPWDPEEKQDVSYPDKQMKKKPRTGCV